MKQQQLFKESPKVGKFRFKKADLGVFSSNSDEVVKDLNQDSRIIGLTRGTFSIIDLIHSVLQKTGKAHVICTTWSAGIKDAHNIKWMIDSDLIQSFKLITDHSFATRQTKYAVSITELFGKENIRTSEVHAKFVLIHNDEWNICIRTSMNLNANKTCENFELDTDKGIFDFYMDYITHTLGDMPKGFVKESFRVNQSLDRFFNDTEQPVNSKSWSEL